ncbi:MAG TPA: hypothetical protein VGG03_19400 [Thermoanaerobaculia bacterium]|jgi:hypothetical protein
MRSGFVEREGVQKVVRIGSPRPMQWAAAGRVGNGLGAGTFALASAPPRLWTVNTLRDLRRSLLRRQAGLARSALGAVYQDV